MKAKASEEVGIRFQHITLPEAASVKEIVAVVKRLNDDDSISGILVQLPLGSHVDSDGVRTVTESISPEKDVDGYCFPSAFIGFRLSPLSGSTRIISAFFLHARRRLSLLLALLRQSSVFSSQPVFLSPVPTSLCSVEVISLETLSQPS